MSAYKPEVRKMTLTIAKGLERVLKFYDRDNPRCRTPRQGVGAGEGDRQRGTAAICQRRLGVGHHRGRRDGCCRLAALSFATRHHGDAQSDEADRSENGGPQQAGTGDKPS